MRQFINRLQNKPEHVRRRFAFGVAGGITALIAFVWVSTFWVGGNTELAQDTKKRDGGVVRSAMSGLAGVYAALDNQIDAWRENRTEQEDGQAEVIVVPEGKASSVRVINVTVE